LRHGTSCPATGFTRRSEEDRRAAIMTTRLPCTHTLGAMPSNRPRLAPPTLALVAPLVGRYGKLPFASCHRLLQRNADVRMLIRTCRGSAASCKRVGAPSSLEGVLEQVPKIESRCSALTVAVVVAPLRSIGQNFV